MFKRGEKVQFREQKTWEVGNSGGCFTAARGQDATVWSVDDETIHLKIEDPGWFLTKHNGGFVRLPMGESWILGPYCQREIVRVVYTSDPVSNVLVVHALPPWDAHVRTATLFEWDGDDVEGIVRRAARGLVEDLDPNLTRLAVWNPEKNAWVKTDIDQV